MYKFKIKKLNFSAGPTKVVILNRGDALKHEIHLGDRVLLKYKNKIDYAVVDYDAKGNEIKSGEIGLFSESINHLKIKNSPYISVALRKKPESLNYIKRKLKGEELDKKEIYSIVEDVVKNRLTDVELTYFVSACFMHGLSVDETTELTVAIADVGNKLKLKGRIVDKHCIGGVAGNRTSMIIVPIMAALGYKIPKVSSRSITSPAGTADTVEVLAPVGFSLDKMKRILKKTKGVLVWGGGHNLASADDKLIKIRHPMSLDPEGMILSSIMAKKYAVSSNHLLIDIPVGKGSKITSMKKAKHLKKQFKRISKKLGIKCIVEITDGSQPIGSGIGPALEAKDVLETLEGRGSEDLKEKSLKLSSKMLKLVEGISERKAYKTVKECLESGNALKKFKEILSEQGGRNFNPNKISLGRYNKKIYSSKSGKIKEINNKIISKVVRIAGAPEDKEAGIWLEKKVGDKIKKGELLFTLYSDNKELLSEAVKYYNKNKIKIK